MKKNKGLICILLKGLFVHDSWSLRFGILFKSAVVSCFLNRFTLLFLLIILYEKSTPVPAVSLQPFVFR